MIHGPSNVKFKFLDVFCRNVYKILWQVLLFILLRISQLILKRIKNTLNQLVNVCIYVYVAYLTRLSVAKATEHQMTLLKNDEQDSMWQDVAVTDFKVISKRSPGRTEENHKRSQ